MKAWLLTNPLKPLLRIAWTVLFLFLLCPVIAGVQDDSGNQTMISSPDAMVPYSLPPGADPVKVMEEANTAYNEGLYEEASARYRALTTAGYASPALYYNLGNACFKLDDLPRAILWYERALRLDPGNEDIRYNLQVANSRIADKIDPLPVLFYARWWNGIVALFSLTTWAIIAIFLFVLTLTGMLLYLVARPLMLRKAGFRGAIICLAFTLITLLFSQSAYRSMNRRTAIIFEPTITVKSSPDEKSVDLFVLHEGTRVQLLDQIGNWYEIRIASGSIGWLPASVLEEV